MDDTTVPAIPPGIEVNSTDTKLLARVQECLAHPLADSFREALQTLARLSRNGTGFRVRLWRDFAPLSFNFSVIKPDDSPWIHGGLIFHGSHDRGGDGGAPTYSVCVTPQEGWAIHT